MQPGTTLRGRYDIEAQVGENTWRVRDTQTGQMLACRRYSLTRRADPDAFQEVLDLRRSLALPGIPKVVDLSATVEGGLPVFLLFRVWIEGQSLQERVVERGPMRWERASQVGQLILDALWGLHGQEPPLLHGDLSPSHVIEDADGQVHLISLAALKQATGIGWRASVDADFGAPEALMGEPKPRSDLYSLGGLLVFAVLGETTDIGTNPTESMRMRGVPRSFTDICERLLEPLVDRRYDDLDEVADALAQGEGRERQIDEDEDEDDINTVLGGKTRLADHLERLLPFVPAQFRLAALASVVFFIVLIGFASLGLALQLFGQDEAVEVVAREVPVVPLDMPLSCPGGMEFEKDGPQVRCVDKLGSMVMVPGLVGGRAPFLADENELSVGLYSACVEAGGCSPRPEECAQQPQLPANCLSLEQALAVCRQNRRRLCTDDEFTWMALGHEPRVRPWGDARQTCDNARVEGCGDGPGAVGERDMSATPQGVEDLVGNLAELLADSQVAGGDYTTPMADAEASLRTPLASCEPATVGVRCCRDLD